MRPWLWAGLALALVLAAALWWLVDVRVTQAEVPPAASDASAMQTDEESDLADPGAPADPNGAVEVAREDPAFASALDIVPKPIRGRLIEAHCGRPIESGIRIWLVPSDGPPQFLDVGADGRFATAGAHAAGPVRVKLLEARSGEELNAFTQQFDPSEAEWLWRTSIGLLVPLDIVAPAAAALDDLRAWWVQGERTGPWEWGQRLHGGEQPFVQRLFHDSDRAPATAIEVRAVLPDGRGFVGRGALTTLHGVHDLLRIELAERTRASGRVLDAEGNRVIDARVQLLPLEQGAPRITTSEWDGRFAFEDVEPGPYILRVSSGVCSAEPRRIELGAGANDLGAIALECGDGTIAGAIIGPQGRGNAPVLVSLRDLANGRRWLTWIEGTRRPQRFAFERVPPGRYEVRPIPTAELRFEPASLDVTPPAKGLEFVASRARAGELFLRVVERAGGELLPSFFFAGRIDDLWIAGASVAGAPLPFAAERWVVWADGHGARVVEPPAFEHGVAEVVLEPGWNHVLVFVDAQNERITRARTAPRLDVDAFDPRLAAPLDGVRVVADGQLVATSERDGLAVVSLPGAPALLEFELAGHRVLGESTDGGLRRVWLARSE